MTSRKQQLLPQLQLGQKKLGVRLRQSCEVFISAAARLGGGKYDKMHCVGQTLMVCTKRTLPRLECMR